MSDTEQHHTSGRDQKTPAVTDDVERFVALVGTRGRLLGLDLGTKTVGLAISDVERRIATPRNTLKRSKYAALQNDLSDIVSREAIVGLVLGLPKNLDGSVGPRVQATRAFARNLIADLAIPILFWDERLTTVEAERLLIAADTSRKRRAEVIDAVAAALILQGAIDRLSMLGSAIVDDEHL